MRKRLVLPIAPKCILAYRLDPVPVATAPEWTETLKAGNIITFASVYAVNPER